MTAGPRFQFNISTQPTVRAVAERVWKTRHEMRKACVDLDQFVVRVDWATHRQLMREMRVSHPNDLTVFGLQVVLDSHLSPDSVILRYEVRA